MPGWERCNVHGIGFDPNVGCAICSLEKFRQVVDAHFNLLDQTVMNDRKTAHEELVKVAAETHERLTRLETPLPGTPPPMGSSGPKAQAKEDLL